jgi:hypothetical protein
VDMHPLSGTIPERHDFDDPLEVKHEQDAWDNVLTQ